MPACEQLQAADLSEPPHRAPDQLRRSKFFRFVHHGPVNRMISGRSVL